VVPGERPQSSLRFASASYTLTFSGTHANHARFTPPPPFANSSYPAHLTSKSPGSTPRRPSLKPLSTRYPLPPGGPPGAPSQGRWDPPPPLKHKDSLHANRVEIPPHSTLPQDLLKRHHPASPPPDPFRESSPAKRVKERIPLPKSAPLTPNPPTQTHQPPNTFSRPAQENPRDTPPSHRPLSPITLRMASGIPEPSPS